MIEFSPESAAAYAGCVVGYVGVEFEAPPGLTDELEAKITRREQDFVSHYGESSGAELEALPVLSDYVRHFKRFKKSYHVLLQLVSAAEGKSIPRVSPLVSIMLTSELSTLVAYAVPGVDAAALRAQLDDMVTLIELTGGKPVITGPQVVSVGE